MKVPQYENRVAPGAITAARPQAPTPVSGAFGEKQAQAGAHLAQAVGQMAGEMERSARRFEVRNRNLRLTSAQLNWQKDNDEILNGKIGPDGKRVDGGLLAKQYNDADGIAEDYSGRKKELMDKHLATAATPEEYEELRLYFEKDFQNNFDRVTQHQLKQQRATDDLLTKAFTEDAMQRVAANPETLNEQLGLMTEKAKANWTQNGLPQQVQEANLYVLNGQAVSTAVGTLLERNQTEKAAEVLTVNRDKIDVKTGRALAKQVKTAVVNNLKTQLWNEAGQVRTATGEVDLNYAKRVIAATGYEQSIQDDLLKDLQARMADEKRFKEQRNRERDENFYTAADKLVSGAGTLEQGLKLAAQYANDSKDKFTKEKFIETLFKEHSTRGQAAHSDPEEYLRLWKGISDGSVGEDEVRGSFTNGRLNASDYKALVKECYKSTDEKQGTSFVLKQIEADAKRKISDPADRAMFMLEVKRQSQGKKPEEMVSIANSLLQKTGGWFSKEKYLATSSLNLEQQRVMGDYMRSYPDGGNYVKLISQAVRQEKADPSFEWGEADLEDWTKRYGGQKLFTAGTPENDAINWMLENKVVPTTEDMDFAIDYFYSTRGEKSPKALRESVKQQKEARAAAQKLAAQKQIMKGVHLFINPDEQENYDDII
jgi:hypothetical protein